MEVRYGFWTIKVHLCFFFPMLKNHHHNNNKKKHTHTTKKKSTMVIHHSLPTYSLNLYFIMSYYTHNFYNIFMYTEASIRSGNHVFPVFHSFKLEVWEKTMLSSVMGIGRLGIFVEAPKNGCTKNWSTGPCSCGKRLHLFMENGFESTCFCRTVFSFKNRGAMIYRQPGFHVLAPLPACMAA